MSIAITEFTPSWPLASFNKFTSVWKHHYMVFLFWTLQYLLFDFDHSQNSTSFFLSLTDQKYKIQQCENNIEKQLSDFMVILKFLIYFQ